MITSLLLAAALSFSPADAEFAWSKADYLVKTCTPRDAGTIRGKIAANFILDEASKLGADMRRDSFTATTPQGERTFTNLSCNFETDPSSNWVVIVSHFDTKSGVKCPGANDGASSTTLLMALARVLNGWQNPRSNVMLIWTDGEECMKEYGPNDGFWGSKRAAAKLVEQGRKVRAVICVDMIGDADLHLSVPANGSVPLTKIAKVAAERIGAPDLVKMIPEHVKDDHIAFLDAGFPAIDIIDFEYGPKNAYWHTAEDTMAHVSRESLLKTGRLLCEMLNILL